MSYKYKENRKNDTSERIDKTNDGRNRIYEQQQIAVHRKKK